MKKVGSRELKNRLGHYLRCVRKGETILVTARGRPVARLMAADGAPATDVDARLRELAEKGLIRLGSGKLSPVKPLPMRGKLLSRLIEDMRD